MNGNFEHDKGSYPYAAQYRGDLCEIVNVPSQAVLYEHKLPLAVASKVALAINARFHERDAAGVKQALTPEGMAANIQVAARSALDSHLITGAVYSQIVQKL